MASAGRLLAADAYLVRKVRSRPPRQLRSRAGRRSRAASTRSSMRPPARARRWPRSCGVWIGWRRSRRPDPKRRCRVLYVSPLKALAHDVERNLKAPLVGIGLAARSLDVEPPEIDVAIRTGDTPQRERRDLVRQPPDILITTPESLYLMLTSEARDTLRSVEWVIVDEVHAIAGTKRGAHLALSLERLQELVDGELQRIGLSATQRPLAEIGRFLAGAERTVAIVDAGQREAARARSGGAGRGHGSAGPDPRRPRRRDAADIGSPRRFRARRRGAHLDLALDPSAPARPDPAPHLDARLRQQPPPGGATRAAPQRALSSRRTRTTPTRCWSVPTMARSRASSGWKSKSC